MVNYRNIGVMTGLCVPTDQKTLIGKLNLPELNGRGNTDNALLIIVEARAQEISP